MISPGANQRSSAYRTRKRMTFVNIAAIAYRRNHEAPADFLPACNSSCVHKRYVFASTRTLTVAVLGGALVQRKVIP